MIFPTKVFFHHAKGLLFLALTLASQGSFSATAAGLSWPANCSPETGCVTHIGYPDPDKDGVAFNCQAPGYVGHEGTDIGIKVEDMDAGVDVLAAADGEVLWVFDGKYDRCPNANEPDCQAPTSNVGPGQSQGYRVCTNAGPYCKTGQGSCYLCFDGGNVVVIKHDAKDGVGFAARYDHLKKNSIKVLAGQRVQKGQVIAQIGSAGRSTGPHLHFEVWANTYYDATDPWAGQCNVAPKAIWQDQVKPWSTLLQAPVDGECGPANDTPVSSIPTTGLCRSGQAGTITGSGPWYWTCSGEKGGQPANCSAALIRSNQLTLNITGDGYGEISSNPSGISCYQSPPWIVHIAPPDCEEVYPVGSSVTLTARPSEESYFAGWTGACTGESSTCTVLMQDGKMATANFKLKSSRTSCFFDWAELAYPHIFNPRAKGLDSYADFSFRYYSGSQAFLAEKSGDGHMYYLGPLTDQSLRDLGPAVDWFDLSGCR